MEGVPSLYEQKYKRDPYAFGLGKRNAFASEYGLGKRDPYAFGLGKRGHLYFTKRGVFSFEEQKRDPYAFGLGK